MLVIALSALAVTVVLVAVRPRVGRLGRLHPILGTLPGLTLVAAGGALGASDLLHGVRDLWKPLLTISSIMSTTSVAHRLGIFDRVSRSIEIRTRGPVPRAFTTVFVISAITATVFNNDAAVLILSPIVIPLIRRLYPKRPYLAEPFAFATFGAAGVAPLATSNPMNLIVAERAGMGFNEYLVRMVPVALVGGVVSYAMLRVAFRAQLEDAVAARGREEGSLSPMGAESKGVLAVVLAMLSSYPVLAYFEQPVWIPAVVGAAIVSWLGVRHGLKPSTLVRGVAWDVLLFLFLVFLLALALDNAGIVDVLSNAYAYAGDSRGRQIAVVGATSALGSALMNNHPMAALSSLAVHGVPGDARWRTLAALVGGDLGPRLLPMGSLAGLLWMDLTRRAGLEVRTWTFIRIGLVTTVPALVASLAALWALSLVLP